MSANFDQLLKNLEDSGKKNVSYPAKKYKDKVIDSIWMAGPPNYGSYYVLPVLTEEGNILTVINKVMQITKDAIGYDGPGGKWLRLYPKDLYGITPGSEDDILYDKLQSLFWTIKKSELLSYSNISFKDYYLLQAYTLASFDLNSNLREHPTKPTLFIINTGKFKEAFLEECKSKSSLQGGSPKWMEKIYNRDLVKTNLIKLSLKLVDREYITSYSHSRITEEHHGFTEGKDEVTIDKELFDTSFTCPINQLMRVESNETRWNLELWKGIHDKMEAFYNKSNGIEPTPEIAKEVAPTPVIPVEEEDELPF